jgi:YesN/AraC family two-component response regulator
MKDLSPAMTKLLIVDDEPIVHESIGRILANKPYQLDDVHRIAEALEKLQNNIYDLVITDLMMPEGNGMDLLNAIAEKDYDVGVIILTGYPTINTAIESLKIGALDYLKKPFTPDELTVAIEKNLDLVRQQKIHRKREQMYFDLEKALVSSLDLKELLNLVCSSVVHLLDVKGSALLIFRAQQKKLELATSYGLSDSYVTKGAVDSSKSISRVFQSGLPAVVSESEFDTELQYPAEARKEQIGTIISVPLKVEEQILGFLRIYSQEPRKIDDNEMDILLRYASQAAKAIENAMKFQQLRSDIEGMKQVLTTNN